MNGISLCSLGVYSTKYHHFSFNFATRSNYGAQKHININAVTSLNIINNLQITVIWHNLCSWEWVIKWTNNQTRAVNQKLAKWQQKYKRLQHTWDLCY
jgi:hypothetical protein